MSIINQEDLSYSNVAHEGYEALSAALSLTPPTSEDMARHGKVVLRDYNILVTPQSVTDAGEILTNPSQIENIATFHNGKYGVISVFFARKEPENDHLGKTSAVACTISTTGSRPTLEIINEIPPLKGEDPRLIPNFVIPGTNGKTYGGIAVSTTVATKNSISPHTGAKIKQVFYWGETLQHMEPLFELDDIKNTCPYPLFNLTGDPDDTRLDIFGRPSPHITNFRANDIFDITSEKILDDRNIITKGTLPDKVHTGVNAVSADARHPDYRELSTHNAHVRDDKLRDDRTIKAMTYVICRQSYHIPTKKLVTLQEVARRTDFPTGNVKPSDPGSSQIIDYEHILYGACGNPDSRYMVVGASDTGIAIARKFHIY